MLVLGKDCMSLLVSLWCWAVQNVQAVQDVLFLHLAVGSFMQVPTAVKAGRTAGPLATFS